MRFLLFVLFITQLSFLSHATNAIKNDAGLAKITTIKDFFTESDYSHFTLSPSGKQVAYVKVTAEKYSIFIANVNNDATFEILRADKFSIEHIRSENFIRTIKHDNEITNITWLGNKVLAVRESSRNRFRRFKIITLGIDKEDVVVDKITYLNHEGYWIDPIINNNSQAIFAKYKANDDNDKGYHEDLFLLKLKKDNLDGQTRIKKRLNRGGAKLSHWLIDKKGHRTAGVRYVDKKPELFIRSGSRPKSYRWNHVWTGNTKDVFLPALYEEETASLYVLTNHNTDKVSLQIFDLSSHKMRETVYAHPKYDLTGTMVSNDSVGIVGVRYIEGGIVNQHYFDDRLSIHQTALSKQANADNIYSIEVANDNNNRLFSVSGSDNSGEIFVYREQKNDYKSIAVLKPWLKSAALQKSKLLNLTTADNTTIEAFVTLPKNIANPPLVVIPHGGPIGVSDSRYYSPEIQVLVNAGFATLQVNYRGSAGYGRKFKQEGMGQWGQLIEDDIELALAHVKSNFAIAKDKVCIIGGSYGGYSALYSVIRSPDLYQCAASFAGVTDLALLFQRSDIENDDDVQSQLREIVGDPATEQEKLFKFSPIYHVSKLTKPLFIAHGTEDTVVDIEHAYRLRFALKANKIKHKWSVLDGVGHGFETTEQANTYYSQLISFLNKHLKAQVTVK